MYRDNFALRNITRGQIMKMAIGGVRKIRSTIQNLKIKSEKYVDNLECEIQMS